jgi:DNA-binding SARP family transcriptional activator/tetratricopeptide (TPR) repeat protein
MEFRVLGPLEVVDGGRVLDLGGQKQRALLALLVLDANRPVSRDRLIDALWEDRPTPTAAKALQVYVSQLRKTLGRDRVVTAPGGYLLRAEADEVDLARFERLHGDGRPHDALALWRGEPLTEFARAQFAQPDIARLEELHLACLESRVAADLADGRDVVAELEALVREHPLRERLRELLILALYRAGRQADALAAYQDAREALVEELGIEPGKALRDLQQSILRQDPALDLAAAAPARSTFVGRGDELAQLVAGLDDAIAGRGRLFLLVGDAGIGKSRLADELIEVARARRVDVLVGRCWEAGGAPAYWPWVQSLRELGGDALFESERDAADEGARFRLFDTTARFLATQERPLVLFLDDMHAADEPSLLLLEFVARQLASMRVLVVVASRDAGSLAEVTREPVTTRLALRGLSEQAVGDYVEAELESREFAAALHERTDGNPLFLAETVRLLAAEGRIAIPPSLRDVITRRLARLGDECNRMLVLAAVLGREFDHAALAAMGGLTDERLLDALDEAMSARVVTDVPDARDRSRFAHVLIRDALYESLTPARRTQLHRAALAVLEDDAEIAFHATAGSDYETALAAARRAGDRALSLLAYEEAARLYDVALAARPDDATRCELLLARGEAESRAGRTPAAKETFVAAAAMARELRLPKALARAAVGYGGRIVWVRAADDARLVPMLEEALAALPLDERELRARVLGRLSGALRDEPDRSRREALSAEAVELGRTTGDPAVLAAALDAYGYAILGPDTLGRCHDVARELRAAAEAAGDPERAIAARMLALMALLPLGRISETKRELDAGAQLAAELGQRAQIGQALGVRAMLALAEGRLDEGDAMRNERYALGRGTLLEESVAIYRCQGHALLELRGADLDEIEPEIAELALRFPARPVFRCVLAHIHAHTGRAGEAREALAELVQGLPFDQEWLYGMSLLAEAAALIDDADAAAVLYDALLPWAGLNAVDVAEGCRGSVARYVGLLAATLGRREEAAEHFRRAIGENERMGFAPWAERARGDVERIVGAAPA